MKAHIDGERLLGFLDGSLDDAASAATAAHLADCTDCRRRFDEHCEFEAALAHAPDWTPALRRQVQAATRSALLGGSGRTTRWLRWSLSMAAAALLAGVALWALAGDDCRVVVHLNAPQGVVRAGEERRIHLEVTAPDAHWLAVFGREAGGRVQRLLPHVDPTLGLLAVPQPLPAGSAVRVPGADLFDFAIDDASPLVELVLVFAENPFPATDLTQLAAQLAAEPVGTLPAAIVDAYPLARRIGVPR